MRTKTGAAKRMLSLLLTLVMLMGLMPAAFAAEEQPTADVVEQTHQVEEQPVADGDGQMPQAEQPTSTDADEQTPQAEEQPTAEVVSGEPQTDAEPSEDVSKQPAAEGDTASIAANIADTVEDALAPQSDPAMPELTFWKSRTSSSTSQKIADLSSVTYGSCYLQAAGEGTVYYYVTQTANAEIAAAEVKRSGAKYETARVEISNKAPYVGGSLYVYAAAEKDGTLTSVSSYILTINAMTSTPGYSTAARATDGTVYSNGLYRGETAVVTWKLANSLSGKNATFYYQVGDGNEIEASSVSGDEASADIPYVENRDTVNVDVWYTVNDDGAGVHTSSRRTVTLTWRQDESGDAFTVVTVDGAERQKFSGSQVNRIMTYIQSKNLDNATIRLDKDFSSGEYSTLIQVPVGISVTLDLNGHTFATETRRGGMEAIAVGAASGGKATMTIKDTGTEKGCFNSIYPISVKKDGVLNIEGVKFVQDNASRIISMNGSGTCTVTGGSFRHGGAAIESSAATVTVTGASFDGPLNTSKAFQVSGGACTLSNVTVNTAGVAIESGTTPCVTVKSGSYVTSGDTVIKGAAKIEGGTFAANNSDPYAAFSTYAAIETPENKMLLYSEGDKCFTLQDTPNAQASGGLTVTPTGGVEQSFTNAAQAFAKANENGGAVKLTADTALLNSATGITVTGDVTLDLNGHSLTLDPLKISESVGCLHIDNGASLTIQDSSEGKAGQLNLNKAYGITLAETHDNGKAVLNIQSGTIIGKKAAVYAQTEGVGEVNITGGALKADSYVVYLYNTANAKGEGANLNMTGGVLSTKGQSAIYAYNIKAAITGGVVRSDGYSAITVYMPDLTVAGNAEVVSTGDVQDGVLSVNYGNSHVTLGGNAYIHTDSQIAPVVYTYYAYVSSVTIQDDVRLESGNRILNDVDSDVTVNVSGGHFKYGTVPFRDSNAVTYKEDGGNTYIISTKADTEGDYAGYYGLVTRDSLTYTDEYGIERKYQDLDALVTAIKSAQAVLSDSDKYTADSMVALQTALENAGKLVTLAEDGTFTSANPNANQSEIDYYTAALTDARGAMKGVSTLDPAHLIDGKYFVSVAMSKAGSSDQSMAAGAVSTDAILVVKDGKAELQLSFQPMYMLTLWGHMLHMWGYNGNTIAEARANAQSFNGDLNTIGSCANELTPIKWYTVDSTINNIVECTKDHDHAAALSTATPTCYPWVVSMPLNYLDKSNKENSTYCARVAVDMMRDMNIGDQNVDVFVQWETLTAISTTATLTVEPMEVSLLVNGTQTVTASVLGGEGYTISYASDDSSVATVDSNGVITAVVAGSTTVKVTAAKNGEEDLVKTISVTVAAANAEAVKVENASAASGAETAEITGDVLVTSGGDDSVEVSGTVTVNAKAEAADTVTVSSVTIKETAADALAASNKTVVIQTGMGDVTLDAALMDQVAAKTGDVKLEIKTAQLPNGTTGSFEKAYALTLDGVSFGAGKATVTVPTALTSGYAYCISDSGSKTERQPLTISGGKASWTTGHFSVWALSASEYTVSGNPGGNPGGVTPGFFLEDGNYYVDISLYKESSNEVSMGDVAFKNNRRALVTVSGGKITTVQVATNPVDVSGYHSGIITFKVTGTSVRVNETGALTTSSPTQSSIKDYTYVKRVTFNMPSAGQPSAADEVTYLDVEFYVPDTPMDSVVDAANGLNARIRFDWSTASATGDSSLKSDDSSARGSSSITGKEIEDVVLTDKDTGIRLNADTEGLSDEATLRVTKITSGSDYDKAAKAMKNEKNAWALYEIVALVDGEVTAPEGSVTVSIPCTEKGLSVYRINDSGTRTTIKGKAENGYYVFSTSSLGLFAVVGELGEAPAVSASGFTDTVGHWAEESINFVVEKGLFSGTSKTTFSPNTAMTRGMFVTVLGRLAGIEVSSGETKFTDVKADAYYAPYVKWANENGIVGGTSVTTYDPDREITRQEMAVMLARYCEYAKIELKGDADAQFADGAEIADWAKAAVETVVKAGLLKGVGDDRFSPASDASRAQVATLLARFMKEYNL